MSAFVKPAPGTKVAATGLASSIVAYYLLNDNSGTVADSSIIGGNPGTVEGALTWGASPDPTVISGECLNGFSGASTDFVDLGSSNVLNPGAAVAYEVWFYPTVSSSQQWLIARDDASLGRSYAIGFNGNIVNTQFSGNAGFTVTTTINYNAWNHLVITGSTVAGLWSAYLNGALIGTLAYAAPSSSTAHTNLGRRSFSGFQEAFVGTIGLASIRNALLSQANVTSLFSNPGIVFPAVAGGWSNYYTVENQNN
jgi:hypothetical protein